MTAISPDSNNSRDSLARRSAFKTLAVLLGFAAIGLVPSESRAQSSICLQLVNELAAIDSGGGFADTSPRYRQFERAVRDQRAQISKTEGAARRNGCGGFNIFNRNASLCSRINSSLKQMYANLRDLEDNMARLSPRGGANQARREALMRDIQRYGCSVRDSERRRVERQPTRRRSLLEQIFGVRTYGDDGFGAGTEYNPDTGLASRYGTYRTLCVRSCDGYYFPISFSTVSERFFEDAQTCQQMCPGADVELYYHRMPTQDSEDMMSVRTDIPYTELPNAFKYREKFNSECSCRTANGFAEITGDAEFTTLEAAKAEAEPRIPTPQFLQDRALDPEALANTGGKLSRDLLTNLVPQPELAGGAKRQSDDKSIRIVGPAFFPVQ